MTYDEALIKWAEKRFSIFSIEKVALEEDFEEGFAYSEYTFEGGSSHIEARIWYKAGKGKVREKAFELEDELETVIKEIFEIAFG